MIKLIFWDRDGVINIGRPPALDQATEEEVRRMYILSRDQFKLVPTIKEAIWLLKSVKLKQVVITKQRCVERGLLSIEQLIDLHNYMQKQLNFQFDDIQVQTHNIKEQSKNELMTAIMRKFDVDGDECALVGDRASDMESAILVKIPVRILVTWQSERDGLLDDLDRAKKLASQIVKTPLAAAKLINSSFLIANSP